MRDSFRIADCQVANFRFSDSAAGDIKIGNWSIGAIENSRETPRSGQGAECPDRLIIKKRLDSFVRFFGSNASALNTPLTYPLTL